MNRVTRVLAATAALVGITGGMVAGASPAHAQLDVNAGQTADHELDLIPGATGDDELISLLPAGPEVAQFADHIVSSHGGGFNYYVDVDLVRHEIPHRDVFDCLVRQGKQVIDTTGTTAQSRLHALAQGPDAACVDAEVAGFADRIVSAVGGAYNFYVDADLVRHEIPHRDVFDCLVRQGKQVIDTTGTTAEGRLFGLARGADATCTAEPPVDPSHLAHTVVSRPGLSIYVDADLVRHNVPDGDTHNCLVHRSADGSTRPVPVIEMTDAVEAQLRTLPSGSNATCDGGTTTGWAAGNDALQAEFLQLINEARSQARVCQSPTGPRTMPAVPPVRLDPALSQASQAHSVDMASTNWFDHVGLDGRGFQQRAVAAGTTSNGENIAAGQSTVAGAVQWWLTSSSGHCLGVMSADATRMGIGFANNTTSKWTNYWTMMTSA